MKKSWGQNQLCPEYKAKAGGLEMEKTGLY